MAELSVIVPVYNVELYIAKCLDSIINQTLKDIEIILVDDGSTDKSGMICDLYASHDERIKVLHKKNDGLSCARNDGIGLSTAKYIMFVDGDDWVEPSFCETPFRNAQNENIDICFFSYNKVFNDGRTTKVDIDTKEGLLEEPDAMRYNVYFACYAWIGLYRRSLFDSVRFPDGMLHEDVGTGHRLIHAAKRIFFIKAFLYNYRVNRPGSITTNLNEREYLDRKTMSIRKIDDLCCWGYEEYARKDALSMLIWEGCHKMSQKKYVDIIRRMKGDIPKEYDKKQRLLLKAFRVSPDLFDLICVLTGNRVNR